MSLACKVPGVVIPDGVEKTIVSMRKNTKLLNIRCCNAVSTEEVCVLLIFLLEGAPPKGNSEGSSGVSTRNGLINVCLQDALTSRILVPIIFSLVMQLRSRERCDIESKKCVESHCVESTYSLHKTIEFILRNSNIVPNRSLPYQWVSPLLLCAQLVLVGSSPSAAQYHWRAIGRPPVMFHISPALSSLRSHIEKELLNSSIMQNHRDIFTLALQEL
jgi:hypothetical protein